VAVLLVLMFANDRDTTYAEHMFAPMGWVQDVLMQPVLQVRPFDALMIIVLLMAWSQGQTKGPWVAPMRSALLIALGTIVLWFLYGVVTGGDVRGASWQTYLILSTILFAFVVAAIFRTPEHYVLLAKAFMIAAAYRALMCWIGYFVVVRPGTIHPMPEYTAAHDDTVLWVVAIIVTVVHALFARKRGGLWKTLLSLALFLGAIQWNSRRLAWVSLIMAVMALVALIPPGTARTRVRKAATVVVPIIAIYVIAGTQSDAHIFRPVQAFMTVSTEEDASTKARNMENLGLIATSNLSSRLVGTGWGHVYHEVSNKYSIASIFELWGYIPHNSILGILAFTGALGFAGFWLAFPTAVFLLARLARQGNTPLARAIGIIGVAQLVVCANQMYGDMGIFFVRSMYVLAAAYAAAMRIPIVTGAWPNPAAARAAAAASAASASKEAAAWQS
jgi:hypothetical protein